MAKDRKIIEIGTCFGRYTVIGGATKIQNKWNDRFTIHYLCRCACGVEKYAALYELLRGKTTSCGCAHKEMMSIRSYKHGYPRDRYYNIWANMKSRCYNKNNKDYHNYGMRGIIVSDEWRNDFKSFRDYITNMDGYDNSDLTIDRIDTNLNYEKGNLRWATHETQSRNVRRSSKNTSGYKGVYYNKRMGYYVASLRVNGVIKCFSKFKSAYDAHLARKQAIIDYELVGYYKGE